MFGGGDKLQPLLHTRKSVADARRPGRRPAAPAQRPRTLLAGVGLLAVAAALALLYRLAPAARGPGTAQPTEEEARDAAREEQLLRGEPSPAFCALPPPLVCAHGGDVAAAPPNTAAAFAAALAGGARCVEVDVSRTLDGQLVVLHSRELGRLLELAGGGAPRGRTAPGAQPQVGDFTWDQLQRLRWAGGEGVERAEDVLRLVADQVEQVTLDVKTHSQAGEAVEEDSLAQAVVDLVARAACTRCLVWAKSDAVVQLVKGLAPALPVGYVVLNETAAARAAGSHSLLRLPAAEVVALHYAMASDGGVTAAARAAGKQVHAWTANTAGMMRGVLDAGVDAVVTNHPRKLQAAIDSRVAACQRQPGWAATRPTRSLFAAVGGGGEAAGGGGAGPGWQRRRQRRVGLAGEFEPG